MDIKTCFLLWFPPFSESIAAAPSRDSVVSRSPLCWASSGHVYKEPIGFVDHRKGLLFSRRLQRANCGATRLSAMANRGPKARLLLRKRTESRRPRAPPRFSRALSLRIAERARFGSFPLRCPAFRWKKRRSNWIMETKWTGDRSEAECCYWCRSWTDQLDRCCSDSSWMRGGVRGLQKAFVLAVGCQTAAD